MSTEVWTAEPSQGFVKMVYLPGSTPYPVQVRHTLKMPGGFDAKASNHAPPPFPLVTPLLQGFSANFGKESNWTEHPLRGMRIDLLKDGWNVVEGQGGIVSQGPNIKVVAAMRDDSGGDPPDDAFVVWVHFSALVVYPG